MQWKRLTVSPAGTPSYWQKSKCLRLESTPSRPMISSTTSPSASSVRIVEEIEKAMVPVVSPTVSTAVFSDLPCPVGIHTSSQSGQSHVLPCPVGIHTSSQSGQSHVLPHPVGIHTSSQSGQSHALPHPLGIHTSSQSEQSHVLPCPGGANIASKDDKMGGNSPRLSSNWVI